MTDLPHEDEDEGRKVALYEALCANPIDLVVVLDTEARYRYLSPSVEFMLGYRPEELVGRLCFDFYHPDDVPRIRQINEASVATAQIPRPVVMRVRHKEGHYVWIEATASPVFEPTSGELVEILGVNRDISDRMRLEHELYEAQRAEIAVRLAGSAAHDLNNLLTIISALGESLERGILDEELRGDATTIRHAALSAGKLTRQLLGLSRPARIESEVFSANDVVEQVAAIADRVDPGRCRVRTRLDPKGPSLRGEASRLEQVLLNLALNACAAAGDEGVDVTLTSRLDGERVTLTCEDDGPGIPKELLERIFEPFFTTRAERGGSGIGLATARRIVDGWGGAISVESTWGEGATFTVSLPAAGASASEIWSRPNAEASRGRVLVIEPQPAVRDAIRRFFTEAGYTCACVNSEKEALRAIEASEAFTVVVADEREDGWELARSVSRRSLTPRILMSGGREAPEELEAGEVYLSKPFSSGDLTGAVRRLLGVPAA